MRIAIRPTNTDGYHGRSTYPLVVDVDYIDLLDVQSNFEFISIPMTEYSTEYDIITEVRDYPKDYGKDFITYSLKPTPVVTLYCDSVSWNGNESKHDNNGTGSREHPFRNLRNAIVKARCLMEQLCCIKVRIIVTGVFNYFVGEYYDDGSGLDCTDVIIDFTQCDIQPILTENYLQHYDSRLSNVYIIGADVSNCTSDNIPFSTTGKSTYDSCIVLIDGNPIARGGVMYNSTTYNGIDMDIDAIHDEKGLQHLTNELHWVGTYIKCDITSSYSLWCGVILDCNIFIKKLDMLYNDIRCMFICGSHIYSEYDSVYIVYIYNDYTPGDQREAVANTMYNTEIHVDTIIMEGVFMHLSGTYTTLKGHLYYSNVSVDNIGGCVYDCTIECSGIDVSVSTGGLYITPSIYLASCVNSTIYLSNELSWWYDGSIQTMYHEIRYLRNSNLICDISFKKIGTDNSDYYLIQDGFTIIRDCEYVIDSNITIDFTLPNREGDNDRSGSEYISIIAIDTDTAVRCSGIINADVSSSGFTNDAHEGSFDEYYCGIRANTYSECTSTNVCRSTATKYCYDGECGPYTLTCIENCIK